MCARTESEREARSAEKICETVQLASALRYPSRTAFRISASAASGVRLSSKSPRIVAGSYAYTIPTSPTTVIGSRVCASIVSLPPCSGKFLSVIEKQVALASGVKFKPVLMRGSMTLPYRVSTQCSVVSTDVHPATTKAAASSANELRIFLPRSEWSGRGDGRPVRAPPPRAPRNGRLAAGSVSDAIAPDEDGLRGTGEAQRRARDPRHVGAERISTNVEPVRLVIVHAIAVVVGQKQYVVTDNVAPAVRIAIPVAIDVGVRDHLVRAIAAQLERDVERPGVTKRATCGVVLVDAGQTARDRDAVSGPTRGERDRREQQRADDKWSAHTTLRVSAPCGRHYGLALVSVSLDALIRWHT